MSRSINTVTFANGACEGEVLEQGEGDAGTSTTTSDTKVARNPHQPEGWRRDGLNFFVPPPKSERAVALFDLLVELRNF